ncbi:MAG: DinB family protein [Planctomycetota bacterium]|nr:MAG: DinB family protein [Planctomycetota bacterium]
MKSEIQIITEVWQNNRERTLATLDQIAAEDDPPAALAFRPGPGRAHSAWQLMHIAVTEGLFATERLHQRPFDQPELVRRFGRDSVPDDDIPDLEEIRRMLQRTRESLLQAVSQFTDADLERIPEGFAERGWTLRKVLHVIAWHEAHHQGQVHLTQNLFRASRTG